MTKLENGWRADVDLIGSFDSQGKMVYTKRPVFRIERKSEEDAAEFAKFLRDGNIDALYRKQKYGPNAYAWFVEVTNPESMERLRKSAKESGVPFADDCFDRLFPQNRDDWDRVEVWSSRLGKSIPSLRINLEKMTLADWALLKEELATIGVIYEERVATLTSGRVKKGDKTIRVKGAANIEKLSLFFGDRVDPKKDWRNLNNWDDKEFYVNGFIPEMGKCLNLEGKSLEEVNHIKAVLSDLGIDYGIRPASKATKRIAEGDKYLRVSRAEDVRKLTGFTSAWTRETTPSRAYDKTLAGGR
ncbi:MAG: hypothetical protein II942_04130 [Alphaproteobacteria bacterium]|nr:hypothetical protein [Alphaproteobacteria bacterium]